MVITTRPQAAFDDRYYRSIEHNVQSADSSADIYRSSLESSLKIRSFGRKATLTAVGVLALAKGCGLASLVNPALAATGLGMLIWAFGRDSDVRCLMSHERNAANARATLMEIEPDKSEAKMVEHQTSISQFQQRAERHLDLCTRYLDSSKLDNGLARLTLAAGAGVALLAKFGYASPELLWPAVGVAVVGLVASNRTSSDVLHGEEVVHISQKMQKFAGEQLREQDLRVHDAGIPERLVSAMQPGSAQTMLQTASMLVVGGVRVTRRG